MRHHLKLQANNLIFFLCIFTLVVSPTYSSAPKESTKIVRLSPEEFQALTKGIKTHTILLAQGEDSQKKIEEESEKRKEEHQKDVQKQPRGGGGGFWGGFHLGGDFGGRDTALVVFAVVGLVVIFAWIPYFPILFYDYLRNPQDFDTRHMLSLNYTRAPHNRSEYKGENHYREGFLSGLRYSLFLKRKESQQEDFKFGFSGELGHYEFMRTKNDPGVPNFFGEYWLLGPSLMYGQKWFWLQLDLLAGSTFDSDLGLTSKADLSLNVGLSKNIFLGLGFGALYYDVRGGKGLAAGDQDVGLTWTGRLGYAF